MLPKTARRAVATTLAFRPGKGVCRSYEQRDHPARRSDLSLHEICRRAARERCSVRVHRSVFFPDAHEAAICLADRAADDGNVYRRILCKRSYLFQRGAAREKMAPGLGATYWCICFCNLAFDRDAPALGPVHAWP